MTPPPTPSIDYSRARRHLSRRDPVMKAVIAAVGPCTLTLGGDPFALLVRAIVSQMISTLAARSISARIEAACGEDGLTPQAVVNLGADALRTAGLSSAKAAAILDLAGRALDGRLPLGRLGEMTDADILSHLTAVRGVGAWTAEMFLIFGLGRPDVLPVADFGLRAGVRDHYKLDDLPRPNQLREIAAAWQPYRSVATWYIWRSRGFVPQSS